MKKVITFIGVCFVLATSYYVFNWAKSESHAKEQEKKDFIEVIIQKEEIMTTVKNDTRVELSHFGTKVINSASTKQMELCAKQIMHMFTRKKDCTLEELTMNDLSQIDSIYSKGISQALILQTEVENKDFMKMKLDEALSESPATKNNIPTLKVDLPPVGKYCNGCYGAPPGGNPTSSEDILVGGEMITGGHDGPTTDRKWSYVNYIFKGTFPILPTLQGFIIPEDTFLSDIVSLQVNESRDYPKKAEKYTYTKIANTTNKDGLEIYSFLVTPTFDSDSIGRKDAIFTKDGNTYYVMFDWKDTNFDKTFDQIVSSIKFE